MKAFILASGLGTRLQPLTLENPKTLIRVGGKELLARIADTLVQYNITNVVITTGHLREKLEAFMNERYPQLHVTYVNNPDYVTTNYLYSQWLARESLADDDILTFHADLLFDPALVGRLLSSPYSCVLVQEGEHPSAKDFNARVESGLVTEVRVKIQGPGVSFCAPLYKLNKEDFARWMHMIEQFVEEGKVKNYTEDAFNNMSPQFPLYPVFFKTKEICMEVDDFEDLEKAGELLTIA